ncbi:spore germination protein GerPE [Paenibacillus antri]|uniref:Spore germination protein GerPE n=1 Tax=Paenibacillus antri TaxID=2582848 RepID=A0A5R9GKS3_9BACL|nr:spore germination protein GerPE [Paenibacillus antri]TLS53623.1 spore germination protein GerPE [Paenibacillus antri]
MNGRPRTSVVGELFVASVALSSIVLIGDGRIGNSRARAIAVKREYPIYRGDEGSFERYALFRAAIPEPPTLFPADIRFVPERTRIVVGRIDVLAASSSAIIQIGSNGDLANESRQKQFRQLLPESAAAQD